MPDLDPQPQTPEQVLQQATGQLQQLAQPADPAIATEANKQAEEYRKQAQAYLQQALAGQQQQSSPSSLLHNLMGPLVIGLLSTLGQPRRRWDRGLPLRTGIGAGINTYLQQQAQREQQKLKPIDLAKVYGSLASLSEKRAAATTKTDQARINTQIKAIEGVANIAGKEIQGKAAGEKEKALEKYRGVRVGQAEQVHKDMMNLRDAELDFRKLEHADAVKKAEADATAREEHEKDYRDRTAKLAAAKEEKPLSTAEMAPHYYDPATLNKVPPPTTAKELIAMQKKGIIFLHSTQDQGLMSRLEVVQPTLTQMFNTYAKVLGDNPGPGAWKAGLANKIGEVSGKDFNLANFTQGVAELASELPATMGGTQTIRKFMQDLFLHHAVPNEFSTFEAAVTMTMNMERAVQRKQLQIVGRTEDARKISYPTKEEVQAKMRELKAQAAHQMTAPKTGQTGKMLFDPTEEPGQ